MSLTVLVERGKKALEVKNYDEAISQFTAAIKESPESPDLFIHRSNANQRGSHFTAALEDAEQAVLNAIKRAKRELIIEAQFRRGVALSKLKRHADACFVLDLVLAKSKDHKQAGMWKNMAQKALDALDPDDPLRVCTVSEVPDVPTQKADTTSGATKEEASSTAPPPQQTPADKIRYDWYQTSEQVYITLLAKGVPADKAQINISPRSLTIEFPLISSSSSYQLTLEPLFAAVNVEKSTTRVLPSKVEIILAKTTPGQKWSKLESEVPLEDHEAEDNVNESNTIARAILADRPPVAPAYPTSSKKGPKDWDKITADDDEAASGNPDDFFKTIFKGASPDMQRAMMKSYTESNGTSLSTNWEEVSKGKVETLPPDGMEAKSWNR